MSAPRPGPRNLITDVAGLAVGQAQDARVRTGATVILAETPATCAVDVRGGGPCTRETDALSPENLVQQVDAISLSGGSVYGLAAADGVTAWLGAQGRGFSLVQREGAPRSPIVPAACLFDLANGGDKAWGLQPPYRELGIAAAEAAGAAFELGAVGAGYGAMTGRLKGGIGSASIVEEGVTVGALAAANGFGSAVAPGGRAFWAAPFEVDGEFGGLGAAALAADPGDYWTKEVPVPRGNTTLAVIATDLTLTRSQALRVATMAQDGLARAIRPAHTPFDGDVIFVLSTARTPMPESGEAAVMRVGALAADCLARAIARAVYEARAPWDGPVAWRDLSP